MGKDLTSDPDTIVAKTQDDLVAMALPGDVDVTINLGVFRRIGEEIRDHLRQANVIAVDPEIIREGEREPLPPLAKQRVGHLHALAHDLRNRNALAMELDTA